MITAVIPVHNRADLLTRLLQTARAQTLPFSEIVVVDNASTDNAAEVAAQAGCRVLAMPGNTGFARAVNEGWKQAHTPWVAVLNSDVELDPRWAERLLAAAAPCHFAAGTIYDARARDTIDGTYDLLSRSGCAWRAGHGETPVSAGSGEPFDISLVPATACIYRRDLLETLGGFDESFGSYMEDVDLGLRSARAGFHGVFVPGAIAWHHGSATLGRWNARVVRLISRNQLRLIARHYDAPLFRECLASIVAGQLLWGLVCLRHGALVAWLLGKLEALHGFRLQGEPSPALRRLLSSCEAEIRTRAKDSYWRWYFRLTAGSAS